MSGSSSPSHELPSALFLILTDALQWNLIGRRCTLHKGGAGAGQRGRCGRGLCPSLATFWHPGLLEIIKPAMCSKMRAWCATSTAAGAFLPLQRGRRRPGGRWEIAGVVCNMQERNDVLMVVSNLKMRTLDYGALAKASSLLLVTTLRASGFSTSHSPISSMSEMSPAIMNRIMARSSLGRP